MSDIGAYRLLDHGHFTPQNDTQNLCSPKTHKKIWMSNRPPFKGRPADEILGYVRACLPEQLNNVTHVPRDLFTFLAEVDADCQLNVQIDKLTENPSGLTPVAMVEKMDMILDSLASNLNHGFTDDLYIDLLDIFEHLILKIYQPHYIQYMTFYAASSSKSRAEGLLSLLLNIIHDESSDPITRRQALAYIGSFVTRAAFLSGRHSARTAKYLVSFLHALNISKSASDRLLFVLTLQTVCDMICWECSRWKCMEDQCDMDWLYRSKKGLVPLLLKVREEGVLRLVSLDLLRKLQPLVGRLSVQLKELVAEAIRNYKQLLHPTWKPLTESDVLKPYFPFDRFDNLPRSTARFDPLFRRWVDPEPCADARDGPLRNMEKQTETTDHSSVEHFDVDTSGDIWSFHPIREALGASPLAGPSDPNFLMPSPFIQPQEGSDIEMSMDIGDNLVLTRILSAKTFAPAPEEQPVNKKVKADTLI
jgi:hypothetical protein